MDIERRGLPFCPSKRACEIQNPKLGSIFERTSGLVSYLGDRFPTSLPFVSFSISLCYRPQHFFFKPATRFQPKTSLESLPRPLLDVRFLWRRKQGNAQHNHAHNRPQLRLGYDIRRQVEHLSGFKPDTPAVWLIFRFGFCCCIHLFSCVRWLYHSCYHCRRTVGVQKDNVLLLSARGPFTAGCRGSGIQLSSVGPFHGPPWSRCWGVLSHGLQDIKRSSEPKKGTYSFPYQFRHGVRHDRRSSFGGSRAEAI